MGQVSKNLNKCCVCPCKRAVCSIPVAILSFVSLAFTIYTLYMCLVFQRSRFYNLPGFLYDYSVGLVIWIFVISIISLLAVVMGIASGCLKNRCIVITFGCLFLPVWLVFMMTAGSIAAFIESASLNPDGLQIFCDPESEKEGPFGKNMKSYADDL